MSHRTGNSPLKQTETPDGKAASGECAPAEPNSGRQPRSPLSNFQFRLAVLQHHRLVYRFSCTLLRNSHDAEDVTQDTFMRYWQRGADVQRPREWLLQVARNACLDRLRSSQRLQLGSADSAAELPDVRDPAWYYQQGELAARLEGLIDTLPEPQRSLIVLFDVQGVKGDACARILGISVNQVKVYLHRARKRLRGKLEQSS